MKCAPSEDSDQPAHPRSLIRVLTVRLERLGSVPIRRALGEDSVQHMRVRRLIWFNALLKGWYRSCKDVRKITSFSFIDSFSESVVVAVAAAVRFNFNWDKHQRHKKLRHCPCPPQVYCCFCCADFWRCQVPNAERVSVECVMCMCLYSIVFMDHSYTLGAAVCHQALPCQFIEHKLL